MVNVSRRMSRVSSSPWLRRRSSTGVSAIANSPGFSVSSRAARLPLSTAEIYSGCNGVRDWVSYQL
ncbi:hypothetical protein D3C80_1566640 [compost metagenome]